MRKRRIEFSAWYDINYGTHEHKWVRAPHKYGRSIFWTPTSVSSSMNPHPIWMVQPSEELTYVRTLRPDDYPNFFIKIGSTNDSDQAEAVALITRKPN